MKHHLLFLAPALLLAACAPSTLQPVTVAPRHTMMLDAGEVSVVQPCAAISDLTVEDARAEGPIGKRFLEQQPSVSQPVSFQGDASEWARAGIEAIFERAQMGRDASKPALRVKVEQIFAEETVYRRAEFDGRVVLVAELVPAGGGAACWSTRVDGFAENYGYAGNLENYQETLNHALDRAALKLLASDLQSKLCGGC